MQIDEKKLSVLKKQLEADRERNFALFNQAVGALLLIDHLEKGDDALSMSDLEKAVGGKVEAIEPVKSDVQNAR